MRGSAGVPSLVGTVGDFREPEMAFVQQPETLLFIEYGGIFAFGLAVIAPHADIGIAGKLRQHIVQLPVEHLLAAENIEPLEFDQPAYPGAAAFPAVAAFGVALIGVTDIVGGHGQLLRNGREHQHGKQGKGQQSFHSNVFGLTELVISGYKDIKTELKFLSPDRGHGNPAGTGYHRPGSSPLRAGGGRFRNTAPGCRAANSHRISRGRALPCRKGNKNTRKTARLTAGKTAGRHKGPDIRARNIKNRT